MDLPRNSPGILTLTSNTNSEVKNIALDIPAQTLILRSYRVQMDSATNALAKRVIYVDLPIVSRNQVLDNNVGHVYLPLSLENAEVTLQSSLELPIYMTDHLSERFTMNLWEVNWATGVFSPLANLVHVTLNFELSIGHLA